MDHETFHSIRQPVADGGGGIRGVASDVMGGVSGDSMQDGSLDGFDVGMFRSRSSHVTAGYSPEGSGSVGGSSHEQLHYVPMDTENQDLPQLRRGQGGGVHTQVRGVSVQLALHYMCTCVC